MRRVLFEVERAFLDALGVKAKIADELLSLLDNLEGDIIERQRSKSVNGDVESMFEKRVVVMQGAGGLLNVPPEFHLLDLQNFPKRGVRRGARTLLAAESLRPYVKPSAM